MTEDMEELENAFTEFERLPFPEDSDDDRASQLHAELAEYDSFIAGSVSTLLVRGDVSPDLLRFDENLKARVEGLIREGRQPAASDAARYLSYLEELRKSIYLARRRY